MLCVYNTQHDGWGKWYHLHVLKQPPKPLNHHSLGPQSYRVGQHLRVYSTLGAGDREGCISSPTTKYYTPNEKGSSVKITQGEVTTSCSLLHTRIGPHPAVVQPQARHTKGTPTIEAAGTPRAPYIKCHLEGTS